MGFPKNEKLNRVLKLLGVSIFGWIAGMVVYLPVFWFLSKGDPKDYVATILGSSFGISFSFYLFIFLPCIALIPSVAPSFKNRGGRIALGIIIGALCGLSWAREPMSFSRFYGGPIALILAFSAMGLAYGWGISRVLDGKASQKEALDDPGDPRA
jgi:hypothetical protein